MSLIASLAPERASSTAIACPIPEAAPVTTATFPANPSMTAPLPGRESAPQFLTFGRPSLYARSYRLESQSGNAGGGTQTPASGLPAPQYSRLTYRRYHDLDCTPGRVRLLSDSAVAREVSPTNG
ncbi:hypothetical protein MCHIJ_12140 [Mycolicibacterium chitae]|nr:hypothetical protein MCHIJ_12140 [Mycolicibacterium chitae]